MRRLYERLTARRHPGLPAHVTCLWDAEATLGECPRWDARAQAVYWTDVPAGMLHRYGLRDGARESWRLGSEIGAIALAADGRVVAALGDTLYWFTAASSELEPWCRLPDLDTRRCRINDGARAPDGSLWLVSMDRDGREPLGQLYRVSHSGEPTVLAGGLRIGNGPAFDAARGVAYVADSPARAIYQMPLDAPHARRTFATLGPRDGFPDGMAVGAGGHLLVAHYDGGCVSRWTPEGRAVGRIAMPISRPTAIAIVPGEDGGEMLVVTSARDAAGRGGGLFAVRPAAPSAS